MPKVLCYNLAMTEETARGVSQKTEKAATRDVDNLIRDRKLALRRLNTLQTQHPDMPSKNDFVRHILHIYGTSSHELKHLSTQEQFDLAMKFLNQDLLVQTFYDANGELTVYGKAYKKLHHAIEPRFYEYCGIRASSFDDGDVEGFVTEYIENFWQDNEAPPIIVLPSYLEIEPTRVVVCSSDTFLPPWGSGTNVTIYTRFDHQFPQFKDESDS